jgi:asparagine synthase (glutamine-hydrolysing)
MLALGFLDISKHELLLARDRLGKKPLYVYISDELLVFSSELKPFIHLNIPLSINQNAIAYYKWLGYIPNGLTIYNECIKLSAGNFLSFDLRRSRLDQYHKKQYWDPLTGYANHFNGSYDEAIEEFLYLLDDATKIRLISDVPVGVFLSGGIDSSLIASAVQKTNPGYATAFTVKFMQSDFDESPIAVETAKQLNIDIELLNLDSEDLSRQTEIIPYHYDEPFSDSSQIPTLAISEAARKKVTVVLTGDGGDEVFLGYPRYSFLTKLDRLRKIINRIPMANNLVMSLLRSGIGKSSFISLLKLYGGNIRKVDSSINRIRTALEADSLYQVYDAIMSIHQISSLSSTDRTHIRKSLYDIVKDWYPEYSWQALEKRTLKEHFSAIDIITFMRDDVLVKVDRATMAYSLEARSPLLDYRIVEFGTSLPEHYKASKGMNKMILRDALAKRLRGKLTKLQKSGFDVPLTGSLPAGPDPQSQWNNFIFMQWKKSYMEA